MMESLYAEQSSGWSQVAPLIMARQRQMAERQAELSGAGSTDATAPTRPDPLRAPESARVARSAVSGEGGLGKGAQERADPKEDATNAQGLTEAEQEVVAKLKARDAEVRRHEQAHASVGGQYAGAPTYTYQTGPDGQQYAIGGAVEIDVSVIDGDPAATIEKMVVVKAAALAPAEPSAEDKQVASLADAQRVRAVADLAAVRADAQAGEIDRFV